MSSTKAAAGSASSSASSAPSGMRPSSTAGRRDVREDCCPRALRLAKAVLLDAPDRRAEGAYYGFVVVRGKVDGEDALVLWPQIRRERSLKRHPVIRPTDPGFEQCAVLAVTE